MANYPTSASTNANLYVAVNNLRTTLNGAINNSVTTVTVASTTGFPTAGFISIESEIIAYTGTNATQFTGCTRGADGTTAASHIDLTIVNHRIVAAHHNALKDEVIAVETDLVGLNASITPVTATNTATSVLNRIAMVVQQIKTIAGITNWYDLPVTYATLFKYRRPVLKYGSATTVSVEDGIVTGTSGDVSILFPDGSLRTTNNTTFTTFNITRNAVLSGSKQSGLRTSLSEANDTWYALYAVKSTDSNDVITVGDTVQPTRANYATLNTNFGTNGWVFLGMIRNGNVGGQNTDICRFVMSGNMTILYETMTLAASARNTQGIRYAASSGVSTLAYATTIGTGSNDIPASFGMCLWTGAQQQITREFQTSDSNVNGASGTSNCFSIVSATGLGSVQAEAWLPAERGFGVANSGGATANTALVLRGWTDTVLGVGSNPIL